MDRRGGSLLVAERGEGMLGLLPDAEAALYIRGQERGEERGERRLLLRYKREKYKNKGKNFAEEKKSGEEEVGGSVG